MSAETDKRELAYNNENDGVAIGAGNSVKFHARGGTDTTTNRYLNIPGGMSYGIEVIPTVDCSITNINDRTLKTAISIDAVSGFKPKYGRFKNITIQAGSTTTVEVSMKS